jgi:hypothetical protein
MGSPYTGRVTISLMSDHTTAAGSELAELSGSKAQFLDGHTGAATWVTI